PSRGQQRRAQPTPTFASYLDRIEATFGAIDELVCKNADHLDRIEATLGAIDELVCTNADHLDRDAVGHALAEHVRHRTSPAERARRRLEAATRRERRAAKTTA